MQHHKSLTKSTSQLKYNILEEKGSFTINKKYQITEQQCYIQKKEMLIKNCTVNDSLIGEKIKYKFILKFILTFLVTYKLSNVPFKVSKSFELLIYKDPKNRLEYQSVRLLLSLGNIFIISTNS